MIKLSKPLKTDYRLDVCRRRVHMDKVQFADIPPDEIALLEELGITEDSEGLGFSNNEQWEWLDADGCSRLVAEKVDLLTLSTISGISEDEWYFSRLKFPDKNAYAYIFDASYCAGSFVIGGIGSADAEVALKILARIIAWEDARFPSSITIHREFGINSDRIASVYETLEYYAQDKLQFIEELKRCKIMKQ